MSRRKPPPAAGPDRTTTALRRYQRLECPGLWRPAPGAQRRPVNVALREASLVIADARSGAALSHWSLPAVVRLAPGLPASFAPGRGAGESLEIEDATMAEALDTLGAVIAAHRRAGGRVRRAIPLALAAVVALAAAVWLPGAIVAAAARVLPAAAREAIGAAVATDAARLAGPVCNAPLGRRALDRLAAVLAPAAGGRLQIAVLAGEGVPAVWAAHLPGRRVLLGRGALEAADGPALAAALVLAEAEAARATDPVLPVLRHAGSLATLRLLATGDLPAGALEGYAARLLAAPPSRVPVAALAARLEAAGVPATPYALAAAADDDAAAALVAGDAARDAPPPPLLSDGDWVGLQGICAP